METMETVETMETMETVETMQTMETVVLISCFYVHGERATNQDDGLRLPHEYLNLTFKDKNN